jgi:hypothetical protein
VSSEDPYECSLARSKIEQVSRPFPFPFVTMTVSLDAIFHDAVVRARHSETDWRARPIGAVI